MKLGVADGTVYILAILLLGLELTMWYGCYLDAEESLHKDRLIAISASCNEQADLYSERLDCADIKRSKQPGISWLRSARCLVGKHNVFAMLGWFQLGAVFALGVVLVGLFLRYRLRWQKAAGKERRAQMLLGHVPHVYAPRHQSNQHYQTWPHPRRPDHIEDIDD